MDGNTDQMDADFLTKPVLSIETATPICSVALRLPDGSIHELRAEGKGVHSEQTFVFTEHLLAREKLAVTDLGGIIVSAGPGSYTGLRVASSAVKGLLFQTDVPLYAFQTLGGIALGAWQEAGGAGTGAGPGSGTGAGCDTVIDARRNHLYHQSWKFLEDGVEAESEVTVKELEEVMERWQSGRVVTGTGLERLKTIAPGSSEIAQKLQELPVSNVVSATHILSALGRGSGEQAQKLIKKVAPEHFEPYYYTGL